jgi:hypothetical protein
VVGRLRAAGYRPRLHSFSYDLFRETRPPRLELVGPGAKQYREGPDFLTANTRQWSERRKCSSSPRLLERLIRSDFAASAAPFASRAAALRALQKAQLPSRPARAVLSP